jgi:hypothetical protein
MVHAAQQNFKLHIMFPSILQQHSKFIYMCVKKQFSNLHQNPKLHPIKSFPFKSILEIKLIKCFNLVQLIKCLIPTLLNFYHSPNNINN